MDAQALAPVWETVGLELGITRGTLIFIKSQNHGDALACARQVISILPTVDVDALRRLPRAVERAKQRSKTRPTAFVTPPPSAPPAPETDAPPPYSARNE